MLDSLVCSCSLNCYSRSNIRDTCFTRSASSSSRKLETAENLEKKKWRKKWSDGVVERWNAGVLECWGGKREISDGGPRWTPSIPLQPDPLEHYLKHNYRMLITFENGSI